MSGQRFVALLRGINVGGRNKVRMSELRQAFEAAGHGDVQTYIQSGNVIFTSRGSSRRLESAVEAVLEDRFGWPIVVVVLAEIEFRAVVDNAPRGFGATPDEHHSDVVFLKSAVTSEQAMSVVRLRDGVDRAWPGDGVVYFERVSALRTRSRMSAIVGTPEYQSMTIRSWATTKKLLSLLDSDKTAGQPRKEGGT